MLAESVGPTNSLSDILLLLLLRRRRTGQADGRRRSHWLLVLLVRPLDGLARRKWRLAPVERLWRVRRSLRRMGHKLARLAQVVRLLIEAARL